MLCYLLQILDDRQLLRTERLALTAFDAGVGGGEPFCKLAVFISAWARIEFLVSVVKGEVRGDRNALRTSVNAVFTARAGDRDAVSYHSRTLEYRLGLLGSEGLEARHIRGVVNDLLKGVHS